jgi:hypothetical protein
MNFVTIRNSQFMKRQHVRGEDNMAEKGKADKAKKEPRKKAALTLKEKRKLKNGKKGNE